MSLSSPGHLQPLGALGTSPGPDLEGAQGKTSGPLFQRPPLSLTPPHISLRFPVLGGAGRQDPGTAASHSRLFPSSAAGKPGPRPIWTFYCQRPPRACLPFVHHSEQSVQGTHSCFLILPHYLTSQLLARSLGAGSIQHIKFIQFFFEERPVAESWRREHQEYFCSQTSKCTRKC